MNININAFLNARLSRKHYLFGMLFFGTIVYLLVGFPIIFKTSNTSLAQGFAFLAFFPFILILVNRRCHDMGASGKYYFVFAIANQIFNFFLLGSMEPTLSTIINTAFSLMNFGIGLTLLLTSGTDGENRYGDPTNTLPFFESLFPKNNMKTTSSIPSGTSDNKHFSENDKQTILYTDKPVKRSRTKTFLIFIAIVCLLLVSVSIFYYLVIRPNNMANELGRCLLRAEQEYPRNLKYQQNYKDNCYKQFK